MIYHFQKNYGANDKERFSKLHFYIFIKKYFVIVQALEEYFPQLSKSPALKKELAAACQLIKLEKGTTILRTGAYIKLIPLVISGLIKVYKEEENGNELLLYYIKPGESCVMSVTTLMRRETSSIKAIVEQDAEVVVLPSNKALEIAKTQSQWNEFIYDLFNLKFEELLTTIETLTFSNKDKRLLDYLKKEAKLKGNTILQTTHQQIAYELGSSREVISRLLKKLENEGIVSLKQGAIKILKTEE
ncbi:Crp/Fnr family transcriptional regulator [Sungkyunkwania multivorans]|uniref:Crp/Fnr family transcriptional regulator n=1 Tax=Sungkyunkwania multivorans TaxID=1173618 RepID=A0ABW3D0B5_9FLAO